MASNLAKMVDKIKKDSKRASKMLTSVGKEKQERASKKAKLAEERQQAADVSAAAAPKPAPTKRAQKGREVAINKYIKTVLDTLRGNRRPMTSSELKERCSVDVTQYKALYSELKDNPKISYNESTQRWQYKAKYDVSGKDELLALVNKHPEGLPWVDIHDLYNDKDEVKADLYALFEEGMVYLLKNVDTNQEVVYPRERRFELVVDDDICDLWRSVPVPADEYGLKQELTNLGLPVAPRQSKSVYRPSNERRKKIRRQVTRQAKLQNTHVADLLPQHPQPPKPE